jgi:protein TonB
MAAGVIEHRREQEGFGGSFAGAIALHMLALGIIVAFAIWGHFHGQQLGGARQIEGAIQASMVSAIPLPQEAPPVDKQVLAPEVVSKAAETPKPETITPPKPTDIEVKAKTPDKTAKTAAVATPAPPKHPQPTPDTTKAAVGQQAAQLMQMTTQVGTSSSTITVMQQSVGARYAYYFGIVNQTIGRNWYKGEADPRASTGRKVTIVFDIGRDGTPQNIHVESASGSPTLDQSAVRALERIESFGPSPVPGSVTIRDTFVY